MYKCICGKEFKTSQGFNGHRTLCKEYQIQTYGEEHYLENLEKQEIKTQKAQQQRKLSALNQREQKAQQWIEEQHHCERCGKLMTEKYGSGRFCSRYCANSKEHSQKDKEQISLSLLKYYDNNPRISKKTGKPICIRHCSICNKKIKSCNKTGLCQDCLRHTPQGKSLSSQTSKLTQEKLLAEGKHKGWSSRNIKSYAEQFWEKVLNNNNIEYQREVPIKHDSSNYFLDFLIIKNDKLLDLEIDGKQHKYKERQESDILRDEFLTNNNYTVYRIEWNEISSEEGSMKMKTKIDTFLEYYYSL